MVLPSATVWAAIVVTVISDAPFGEGWPSFYRSRFLIGSKYSISAILGLLVAISQLVSRVVVLSDPISSLSYSTRFWWLGVGCVIKFKKLLRDFNIGSYSIFWFWMSGVGVCCDLSGYFWRCYATCKIHLRSIFVRGRNSLTILHASFKATSTCFVRADRPQLETPYSAA